VTNGHTPALTGSTSDPEFRRRRAALAARTRASLDHHIKKVVDAAPELTPDQRDRLALIFKTSPAEAGDHLGGDAA
jgi:hypothetical protein